jgi:hypothetical protein
MFGAFCTVVDVNRSTIIFATKKKGAIFSFGSVCIFKLQLFKGGPETRRAVRAGMLLDGPHAADLVLAEPMTSERAGWAVTCLKMPIGRRQSKQNKPRNGIVRKI